MYVYLIYVKLTDFTVQQKHNTAEQPIVLRKKGFFTRQKTVSMVLGT